MRHSKKFNHLGRKSNHRKAMLANMATSLIMHKKIKTTVAKAKALRTYVEPLITKSKDDSTHSRRVVFGYLQNKDAVSELFREISPKIMERPGGYTRILKTGYRAGDSADMCIIELVDYNENLLAAKSAGEVKAGKRRRRGGSKKKEEARAQAPEAKDQKPAEEIQTSEEEAIRTDEQAVTAETEGVETETAAEVTAEEITENEAGEIAEAAEENVPEDKPEQQEEKKEDNAEDEEKKA